MNISQIFIIKKTFQNIEKAQLVLHLIDASKIELLQGKISELEEKYPAKKILTLVNKADLLSNNDIQQNNNSQQEEYDYRDHQNHQQSIEDFTSLLAGGKRKISKGKYKFLFNFLNRYATK